MRGLKALISTTALLAGLALVPAAHAQISINIGVQPACAYGYYGYAPYACAPMGYYGSGYFYNGIFLGMGPWAGWGYGHGWGSHRFVNDGGGRYHGGAGRVVSSEHSNAVQAQRSGGVSRVAAVNSHAGGARPNAGHGPTHSPAPRGDAGQSHGNGGQSHGSSSGHGGGDHK